MAVATVAAVMRVFLQVRDAAQTVLTLLEEHVNASDIAALARSAMELTTAASPPFARCPPPPRPSGLFASLCARSRTLHALGGQKLSLVITLAFGNTSPSSHACEINYMQSSQLRDGKVKPWMAGRSLARYAP